MNEHEQNDGDNKSKCTIEMNLHLMWIKEKEIQLIALRFSFNVFYFLLLLRSLCPSLIHDEKQTSVHCALNQLTLAPLLNKFLIKKYRTHVFVLSNGSDISCVFFFNCKEMNTTNCMRQFQPMAAHLSDHSNSMSIGFRARFSLQSNDFYYFHRIFYWI